MKLITLLFLMMASACYAGTALDLRVEMEKSPIGLDTAKPRFSWKMKAEEGIYGQVQTAYRLILGTDQNAVSRGRGNVYDSGKVKSDASVLVDLLPKHLEQATDYYWSVQVWDEKGRAGNFAPPEKFDTGYFDKSFWSKDGAIWIESPVARRDTEAVENWIRYSVANHRGALGSRSKPGGQYDKYKKLVSDQEVADYEDRMKAMMRRAIQPASLFRKEFTAPKIVKARLYVSGLGYYRAHINGAMVGDRILAPSDSDFWAYTFYNVYDVTEMINRGKNCIGLEVANGRWYSSPGTHPRAYYNRPVAIGRLELTDDRGRIHSIVTDENWQAGEHGILRSGFWIGELFDANLYPKGWNTPEFNATHWQAAVPAQKFPKEEILRDPMPPQTIVEYHDPVSMTEPRPGVYVFDFGKQISGRAKLKLDNLTKGQEIILRYSEIKTGDAPKPVPTAMAWYPDFNNDRQQPGMLQFKRRGSVASHYGLNYGGENDRTKGRLGSYQIGGAHLYTDQYVAEGNGEEIFEPKFTYVVFRYLEVLGLKEKPTGDAVQAFTLRTDPEPAGRLITDNPKLNKVIEGTFASLMANYHSHYQDNAGAERNSFVINEGFNLDNSMYRFNMHPQLTKVIIGLSNRYRKYDFYPSLYSGQRHMDWMKNRFFHLSSSAAYPYLAEGMISFYNDQRLGKYFSKWLPGYVEALIYTYWNHDHNKGSGSHQSTTSLGIYPKNKITRGGDVIDRPFFKAAIIMYAGHNAEKIMNDLGYPEEAKKINALIKTFNQRVVADESLNFFDKETKLWDPDAFSRMGVDNLTFMGRLEPRRPDKELIKSIVKEIEELGYLTTGMKTSYELLSTITQAGYTETAAKVLLREAYPGLLYSISQTGNTVAEGWMMQDSYAQIEGMAAMGKWFYRDMVGIKPSIKYPAFKRFSLKPHVPSAVGKFDFTYDSPRGDIGSHWEEKDGNIHWTIVVPPNSAAEVHVPTKEKLSPQAGMRFLRSEGGREVYEFLSGKYTLYFASDTSQFF